jgi:hypothetical protein
MGVFAGTANTLLDAQMRANRILSTAAALNPQDHVLKSPAASAVLRVAWRETSASA